MTALIVVQAVAIALLGLLVVGLLRSHAEILRALHHLGIDYLSDAPSSRRGDQTPLARATSESSVAHDIVGETPAGDAIAVGASNADAHLLLMFLSSGCDKCERFWTAFASGAHQLLGVRVVAVTQGPERESLSLLDERARTGVEIVMSTQAWQDYQIPGSPYAVFCSAGQVAGEGSAQTWEQLASLVEQALADARAIDRRRARDEGIERARRELERQRSMSVQREARYDEALLAAGIGPHDPRLFHQDHTRPTAG